MDNIKTSVRVGDPQTSKTAAAEAMPRFNTVRLAVLHVIQAYGPLTLDELVDRYKYGSGSRGDLWPRASDSSIRTRAKELTRDGLVEVLADQLGQSNYGNPARLLRATRI